MKKVLKKQPIYIAASFLIPLAIFTIALVWLNVTPFGDKTLLIADANGLYVNYLSCFGRIVKGLKDFNYSFEKGLGGNMLPNIGITMLDPFFPLFAAFDIRNYPAAFSLICCLNISLCGLTMYLLLAEIYGHKRSNLIFSTIYALAGFNVANVFQVFFFSGVHALPLMVLGLRRMRQGKSPLLYILSLGYAILTSYYFGFMLCVASALLFLLSLWLYKDELQGKRRGLVFKYTLSSLCAGLLGAAIWLPSILGISGGRLNQTKITDFTISETMPFLEIGSKLFTGANSTDELVNGRPNIYVGILPLALLILFFLNKKIEVRRKQAAGIALGFYLLSFSIIGFNMVMHGGTVTNWFNFRDSFILSFLILLIAAYEWQYIKTIPFHDCKTCFFILLGVIILVFSKVYGFVSGGMVVFDLALLVLIFLAFRMYRSDEDKNPQRVFELIVMLICAFQLTVNFYTSTEDIQKKEGWSTTVSEYRKAVEAVAPLANGIQKGDTTFYRMEVNNQRAGNCGNDPMLYGYNGVGHSGSYERDFVRSEIAKLGIQWFETRNYYAEGIPAATDTLLGLKYILAQENLNEEKAYQNVSRFDESELFQDRDSTEIYHNPDALSVAFLSEPDIEKTELDYTNIFENLNQTWFAVSGENQPVFVAEDEITFIAHNVFDGLSLSADSAREIVESYDNEAEENLDASSLEKESNEKKPPEFTAYIEYSWTAKQDGPVYAYNRAYLKENSGYRSPILEYLGYYKQGETIKGYIETVADYIDRVGFEEIAGRFRAAYADNDALHELATIVKERPCTIEKVKDSHLRGEFTAEDGQLLMFTIPYDEGWTCFIDGKQAEIKKVLGVFMAVDAPAGTHSYEMKFFPTGMKTGIGFSAAALLTTAACIPVDSRRRKKASAA